MHLKRCTSLVCSFALLLVAAVDPALSYSQAEPEPAKALRYKISSHGIDVGELKTTFSPVLYKGQHAVRFESRLSVHANLIFFRKTSRSQEDACVTDEGTLSYHKRREENGRSYSVEGVLDGGSFRFSLQEEGAARKATIPRTSYDFTTMDCPETRMTREGESMSVRLLDMERAVVVTRRYRFVKSENMEAGGKTIRCKVIDFTDPYNSCRRWVNGDERGVTIVRQEGKGDSGSYSLRLVSLEKG